MTQQITYTQLNVTFFKYYRQNIENINQNCTPLLTTTTSLPNSMDLRPVETGSPQHHNVTSASVGKKIPLLQYICDHEQFS